MERYAHIFPQCQTALTKRCHALSVLLAAICWVILTSLDSRLHKKLGGFLMPNLMTSINSQLKHYTPHCKLCIYAGCRMTPKGSSQRGPTLGKAEKDRIVIVYSSLLPQLIELSKQKAVGRGCDFSLNF